MEPLFDTKVANEYISSLRDALPSSQPVSSRCDNEGVKSFKPTQISAIQTNLDEKNCMNGCNLADPSPDNAAMSIIDALMNSKCMPEAYVCTTKAKSSVVTAF
jgi:hypothetical protein